MPNGRRPRTVSPNPAPPIRPLDPDSAGGSGRLIVRTYRDPSLWILPPDCEIEFDLYVSENKPEEGRVIGGESSIARNLSERTLPIGKWISVPALPEGELPAELAEPDAHARMMITSGEKTLPYNAQVVLWLP